MRILRLELRAFGPFTDTTLELDQGIFGLHVICGPNEAGKSSALRALRQLLYGIEVRSRDNFVHQYASLRIGAELQDGQGRRLHVVRRKGAKDTLRSADESEAIDPNLLAQILGGVDEHAFRQRFGIDHQELIEGSQDIVHGGGDLGKILFATGSGVADLNAIQLRLAAEAEQLFKPQGTLPRINKALSELHAVRKSCKEARLRPDEWNQHIEMLKDAETECAQVVDALAGKTAEKQRHERVLKARPLAQKRLQLIEQLKSLHDVPLLADDFSDRRREAESLRAGAENSLKQASETLADVESDLASLHVAEPLLRQSAAIQRLKEQLGAQRKAARDRPRLAGESEILEREAKSLLQELGREPVLGESQGLVLSRQQRQTIQQSAAQRDALLTRRDAAQRRCGEIDRQIEDKSRQLAAGGTPPDTSELRRAIRRGQRAGDLEGQRAKLQSEAARTEDQAGRWLERLGLWSGTLDKLERLALPPVETLERFETTLRERESELKTWEDRLRELEAEAAQREAEIEELRQRQDALTEEDLQAARELRDAGWKLVLAAWQGGGADQTEAPEFVRQFEPAEDLAQAYSVSVQRADHAADRMRREADHVAQKAHLRAELQRIGARLAETQQRRAAAEQSCRECRQAWTDLWKPLRIEPLPPREMIAWLGRHAELLRAAEDLRSRSMEIGQLRQQIAEHSATLRGALQEAGVPTHEIGPDVTLSDLLERAEVAADRLETMSNQRRQCEEEIESLTRQRPEAQAEWDAVQSDLTNWQQAWEEAMNWLELPADASPETALDVVAAIGELKNKLNEAERLRQRIEGIDRDTQQFAEAVRQLAAELAEDVAEGKAEIAVEQWFERLAASQADQARREKLEEQRDREQERLRQARADIDEANSRLVMLGREAGGRQPAELVAVEEQSRRKREAERQSKDVEDRLLELAVGSTLDELAAEAAAADVSQVEQAIVRLAEELEQLGRRQEELRGTIHRERFELDRMDGSDRAAIADEQAQSLLAQIRGDAEEYVRLRLAALVLQQAIERYREKNQGPVLQRAGRVFAELTLGSFSGLRDDYNDKGEPILVGVRGDGRTVVGVDGMSDGARDQLYLSLRLASLEHFLDQNEPIPFIVDDVLVQFDDDRAAAALRVLGELSDRTQVIFFTHHEHLAQLAGRNVAAGKLFVHRLPESPLGAAPVS